MNKIGMFFLNCLIYSGFLFIISCLEETMEKFTEINTFPKNDVIFHILFYQSKVSRVLLLIGHIVIFAWRVCNV